MKTIITYHRASTDEELDQILKLQKGNLSHLISNEQKKNEGFVTLEHDFEMLKTMNGISQHCLAKEGDKVVGYALSMKQELKNDIPLLVPMFQEIDTALKEQNSAFNYVVMGQICINKNYRGNGIFRTLYQYMAKELRHEFNAIITEVDITNTKSSNAHKAVGFKVLKTHTFNGQQWEIIVLEI